MVKSCLRINGKREISERDNARISPNARSNLFGYAIYEVIAVINGKIFDLDLHLERLQRSLDTVLLKQLDVAELKADLEEVLKANNVTGTSTGYIYMHAWPGTAEPRIFPMGEPVANDYFIYYEDKKVMPQQKPDEGEVSVVYPDLRWALKHVKTIQLMSSSMAATDVRTVGGLEPIYINRDGIITEGGSSNLYIVKDGRIITHPADNDILWGITRIRIIELARKNGIIVEEREFNLNEMLNAEEVFRTSTTMGVQGIKEIIVREHPDRIFKDVTKGIWKPTEAELGTYQIGNGLVGKITTSLSSRYAEYANASTLGISK